MNLEKIKEDIQLYRLRMERGSVVNANFYAHKLAAYTQDLVKRIEELESSSKIK